jgi:hypothetical protein
LYQRHVPDRNPSRRVAGPGWIRDHEISRPVVGEVILKHPLLFMLLVALVAVVLVHVFIFPRDEEVAGETSPGAETAMTTGASSAPASEPEPTGVPVRAFDDYRLGVHLRYPETWEIRTPADLPPGPQGHVLAAVGPPGEASVLVLLHLGPLVPRAGMEMIARRSAEMAGGIIREEGTATFAGGPAYRIVLAGEDRLEETAFFNHRVSLLAVRMIAPGDRPEALADLRLAVEGLRFD